MNSPLSEGCSAWKVFIDLTPDSNLLLIGGGLKNLAHNLAPDAGKLFALDCDTRNLQFAQPGTATGDFGTGISAVVGGDRAGLPFADDSMDVVILSQSPGFLQPNFLLEIRRILKDEGKLFIGADNRYSYEVLSGAGEDGNAPGFLSRLYSFCIRKQPHKYSLGGYKRLLVAAGFPQSDFLGLLTDGHFVEEIVPVAGDFPAWLAPHSEGWRQRLKRSPYFVPTYGIIASARARPWMSIHTSIAEAVARALVHKDPKAAGLQFQKYEITGKQKLVVHAISGDKRLLIKHTFDSKGAESERNNTAVLQHLEAQRPKLSTVPRAITSGVIGQQVFFAETAVEGRPLKHFARGAQRTLLVKSGLDFLLEVNPPELCEHVLLEDALFEKFVGVRLARITPLLQGSTQAEQLQAFFRKHLLGKNMMLGIAHGDFSSNNILIEGSRVSGVFDWEAGSVRDVPARDAISLLVSVHRASGAKLSLAECLALLASRQWPDAVEFNALLDLYAAMGIDEECHAGIVYLSWLNGMDLRLRYGMNEDPVAIERFIHDVVSAARL